MKQWCHAHVNFVQWGEPVVNTVSAILLAANFIYVSTTVFRSHQRDLRSAHGRTAAWLSSRAYHIRFFYLACLWAALMCVQMIHSSPGRRDPDPERAKLNPPSDVLHVAAQTVVESYGTFIEVAFACFVVLGDLGITTIQLTFWTALIVSIACAGGIVGVDTACIVTNINSGGGDQVLVHGNASGWSPRVTSLLCYGWSRVDFKRSDPMQNLEEISTYALFAAFRVVAYAALYIFCVLSNNPRLFTGPRCGCADASTEKALIAAEQIAPRRREAGSTPMGAGLDRGGAARRAAQSASSWRRKLVSFYFILFYSPLHFMRILHTI